MPVQRVSCPTCGTAANVPAGMASVKCPSCGQVWTVNQRSGSSGGQAPAGDPNYDMSEWADLLSAARNRARRRYEAQEMLVVLNTPPAM